MSDARVCVPVRRLQVESSSTGQGANPAVWATGVNCREEWTAVRRRHGYDDGLPPIRSFVEPPAVASASLDGHCGRRAVFAQAGRRKRRQSNKKYKIKRDNLAQDTQSLRLAVPDAPAAGFWPTGWWSIVDFKIGIVPLPVFVILLAVISLYALTGSVPSDILMAIVLLSMGGFACAELGKRIPVIRNIGAAAIFATFIPSFLTFHHLLPDSVLGSVIEFTKNSNFLYLFISCVIVGSILGMDRGVLIQGFLKIFVPLAVASITGGVVGTLVGMALGLGAFHTFFFVVVPIMAGGIGEGAIPLSIGYAQILHQPQGDLFAQVLPPVMLGSLTAILLAGTLNYVGKKYPRLTGEGRLQPGGHDELLRQEDPSGQVDVTTIAAAVVTAVTLYLIGALTQRLFGFPAPVAMLVIAVLLKLARAVSPSLQLGAFHVYKFFSTAVTYPLLFAIGVSLTPWD